MDPFKLLFFSVLLTCSQFHGVVCSQDDFLITYQFPEEKAELECINTGSADKYIWRRNGSIIREDAVKYTSREHGRILMISNTQLADAREYTCEHTDGKILRKVWLAVPQYASSKYQVFYLTAPVDEVYEIKCCVRYEGILSEINYKKDKRERYHSKSSNGEVVYRDTCTASSPTATFHVEFRITIHPIPVPQSPCDYDLSGLSADKTFKVVGAVIFEGKSFKYHPRLNELSSVERENLQSSVCNYMKTEMRRDKPISREFPIRCKMLEIHPITHEAVFQITVYGIHMTSFGLDSDDTGSAEFARVIFHERNESTVGYHLRSLSTAEEINNAYQILFIEGLFTKNNIAYTHEEKYSNFNSTEFKNLNTSVCNHIENWRRTDTVFGKLSVHCTLYAIDIRNMLVVQLSFYKAHLTRAGIHLDRDSVTKAVKGWLKTVRTKIGNYEYKPDVITPYIYATGKVYRGGSVLRDRDQSGGLQPTITSLVNSFFKITVKYDGPQIKCVLLPFNEQDGLLKTKVFQSHEELLHAGMVIRRRYPNVISKYRSKENDRYRYEILLLERPFPQDRRFARGIAMEDHKNLIFRNVIPKLIKNPGSNDIVEPLVHTKSSVIEYAITLLHTEKITREIPQNPWELGLLCHHVFITKIDKEKTEYIPRDCDVLNFDLEKSTITFTLRVPRNIVNCYQLDVDDLKVIWNE